MSSLLQCHASSCSFTFAKALSCSLKTGSSIHFQAFCFLIYFCHYTVTHLIIEIVIALLNTHPIWASKQYLHCVHRSFQRLIWGCSWHAFSAKSSSGIVISSSCVGVVNIIAPPILWFAYLISVHIVKHSLVLWQSTASLEWVLAIISLLCIFVLCQQFVYEACVCQFLQQKLICCVWLFSFACSQAKLPEYKRVFLTMWTEMRYANQRMGGAISVNHYPHQDDEITISLS